MANQDYTTQQSLKTTGQFGIFDISPLTRLGGWAALNGVHTYAEVLERFCGKRLSFSLNPRAIVALHSNQAGGLFVQTDQALYLYKESDLIADEVIDDADNSVVLDETGQHVLAN